MEEARGSCSGGGLERAPTTSLPSEELRTVVAVWNARKLGAPLDDESVSSRKWRWLEDEINA